MRNCKTVPRSACRFVEAAANAFWSCGALHFSQKPIDSFKVAAVSAGRICLYRLKRDRPAALRVRTFQLHRQLSHAAQSQLLNLKFLKEATAGELSLGADRLVSPAALASQWPQRVGELPQELLQKPARLESHTSLTASQLPSDCNQSSCP